ncbi:MAG: hypothetical protein SF028_04820 [Candidatus Sumerlaeia bacterium]|nr:hypothetical protein [Candidatus Sumerlaeia bacterium]
MAAPTWLVEKVAKEAALLQKWSERSNELTWDPLSPERIRQRHLYPTQHSPYSLDPIWNTRHQGLRLWFGGDPAAAAPLLWRAGLHRKLAVLIDAAHRVNGGCRGWLFGRSLQVDVAFLFWGGFLDEFDLVRDYRLKDIAPRGLYTKIPQGKDGDEVASDFELFLYALRWLELGDEAGLAWLTSRFDLSRYEPFIMAWKSGNGLDEEVHRLVERWAKAIKDQEHAYFGQHAFRDLVPFELHSVNAVMRRAGLPLFEPESPIVLHNPYKVLPPVCEPAPDEEDVRLFTHLVPGGFERRLREELNSRPYPDRSRWAELREEEKRREAIWYDRQYGRHLLPKGRSEWFKKEWSFFMAQREAFHDRIENLESLSRIQSIDDLSFDCYPTLVFWFLSAIYSKQSTIEAGLANAGWMSTLLHSVELFLLAAVSSTERRKLTDWRENRRVFAHDFAGAGLWCLVLGHLEGARYIAEHLRRVDDHVTFAELEPNREIGLFARLFLALMDFEEGWEADAKARLRRIGVPAYAALGEQWHSMNGLRRALLGILDYRRNIWSVSHHYSDYTSATFAEDALAVLATRRRLGLPSPKLRHRLTIGNPLFVLPDGPIPRVEPEPEVAKIMKLLRYPECLAEELLCLKALPASAHGDPPPPKLKDKYPTEAELAQFLFGPPQKSEFALNRVTIELVSTLDAEGTLREIFSELPADAWKIDSEVGRRVVTATAFGRTAQLDGTGRTPREVAAWAAELLRPEFDIRLVAETAGEADILVIVRPASFWRLVDAQDPKKVAKVLCAIEPGVAAPTAKPRARKGKP